MLFIGISRRPDIYRGVVRARGEERPQERERAISGQASWQRRRTEGPPEHLGKGLLDGAPIVGHHESSLADDGAMPHWSVIITGVPQAADSAALLPKFSFREGSTKTSASR